MYWLRARLGCAGQARLRILEQVRARVPEVWATAPQALGFSDTELAAFSARIGLAAIAHAFPARGDSARLARIAWWGAALADVSASTPGAQRDSALQACAAFNLGVALFDSAIDDCPRRRLALLAALAPERMRARLLRSAGDVPSLSCEEPAAGLIVGVFDHVLTSSARRFAGEPALLEHLADRLEAMYRSVLGLDDDPFIAKTGPIRFIGTLAGGGDTAASQALYHGLADLCQRWDDALDLLEDMRCFAPNHFLGAGRGAHPMATLGYARRALLRVVGGRLLHAEVAQALASSLRESVDAAEAWNADAYRKTQGLCHALIV